MLRVFVLFALIATSTTSEAQQSNQTPADKVMAFGLIGNDFSKAARERLAELTEAYCSDALTFLPTNTPSEDAWVQNEIKTSDMQKINRLVQTPEFARWRLRDTFRECQLRARSLRQIYAKQTTAAAEAGGFVSVALQFNESQDTMDQLGSVGIKLGDSRIGLLATIRRILLIAALRAAQDDSLRTSTKKRKEAR